MLNNSARIGSSVSRADAAGGPLRARRIEYFKFVSRLGERAESEPREARGRSNNLAGLRLGNYMRQVGIRTGRRFRKYPPFGDAFEPTLLLIELFLFARLFSAAFFQLVLQLKLTEILRSHLL